MGPVGTSSEDAADIEIEAPSVELLNIIESIAGSTCGHLRALIIRESSVEALCRAIHVLLEDVRAQLRGGLSLHPMIVKVCYVFLIALSCVI